MAGAIRGFDDMNGTCLLGPRPRAGSQRPARIPDVTSQPPRPDQSGESDVSGAAPDVPDAGSELIGAERGGIDPHEVDPASRLYWEAEADTYQAEHGRFLASPLASVVTSSDAGAGSAGAATGGRAFVWGPEGVTEAELGLLGPIEGLRGRRVLEVGCGAAQASAWLADLGAHAVGIDIAVNQLRHVDCALRHPSGAKAAAGMTQGGHAGSLAVVAASATALPFADASFDVVFSAYGAIPFVADLAALFGEVRRVLRPGGPWVCSVTHPIRWAFPDDPGPDGLTATMSYFDRLPYVERVPSGQAVYAEFHRTIGDYVAALRATGFTIEAMVEPEWPDWNDQTWNGWSPLRGMLLPGTLILCCVAQ
jgi:SAM-dependent methyltransferase